MTAYHITMLKAKGHYVISFGIGTEKETGATIVFNAYICLQ